MCVIHVNTESGDELSVTGASSVLKLSDVRVQKALAGSARGPGASFVGREQVSPGIEYLDTW